MPADPPVSITLLPANALRLAVAGPLTDGAAPVAFPDLVYESTSDEGQMRWESPGFGANGYLLESGGFGTNTWVLLKQVSSVITALWNGTGSAGNPLGDIEWEADSDETGTPVISVVQSTPVRFSAIDHASIPTEPPVSIVI
jgi:hypothetical protein